MMNLKKLQKLAKARNEALMAFIHSLLYTVQYCEAMMAMTEDFRTITEAAVEADRLRARTQDGHIVPQIWDSITVRAAEERIRQRAEMDGLVYQTTNPPATDGAELTLDTLRDDADHLNNMAPFTANLPYTANPAANQPDPIYACDHTKLIHQQGEDCEHRHLVYCSTCERPYCEECGSEWDNPTAADLYYTYPPQTATTSGTGTTINIDEFEPTTYADHLQIANRRTTW